MVEKSRDDASTSNIPVADGKSNPNVKPSTSSEDEEISRLINGPQPKTLDVKFPEVSLIDGLKTVRISDLKDGYKKPCVRDSLLIGMGAGFGVGGLRAILGGKSARSTAPIFFLICSSSYSDSMQLGCRVLFNQHCCKISILSAVAKNREAEDEDDR